jgi:hypothetical protein
MGEDHGGWIKLTQPGFEVSPIKTMRPGYNGIPMYGNGPDNPAKRLRKTRHGPRNDGKYSTGVKHPISTHSVTCNDTLKLGIETQSAEGRGETVP